MKTKQQVKVKTIRATSFETTKVGKVDKNLPS